MFQEEAVMEVIIPMTGTNKGGDALDILKERYAKGEISKEDFEKMKKDLE